MEKFIEEALLYDFYGELLTEHQKLIYEDFVLNDLSLSEIAEDREISRQGVYDIVRRAGNSFRDMKRSFILLRNLFIRRNASQRSIIMRTRFLSIRRIIRG